MTQEQKQAAKAARWLNDQGWTVELERGKYQWSITRDRIEYWFMTDAELIQYAKEKGMELPAELTGWVPIETAPDDGTWILIFSKTPHGESHTVVRFCEGRWEDPYESYYPYATHWQPLPEPPKETTK
jgi:hypothetical protein